MRDGEGARQVRHFTIFERKEKMSSGDFANNKMNWAQLYPRVDEGGGSSGFGRGSVAGRSTNKTHCFYSGIASCGDCFSS